MRPPPYSDDASASLVWYYLATQAGVPMPLAKRAWRAIAASPSAHALRYSFQRALDRDEAAQTLRDGAGSPQRIMDVLEACVQEKRLSRRDATQLEDTFLRAVDRAGVWR